MYLENNSFKRWGENQEKNLENYQTGQAIARGGLVPWLQKSTRTTPPWGENFPGGRYDHINSKNGWLLCDISIKDKLSLLKLSTALDACCNTSFGKIHGPAEKLCFFIYSLILSM